VHVPATSRLANVCWFFVFSLRPSAMNSTRVAATVSARTSNARPAFRQPHGSAPPAKSHQLRFGHRLQASKAQRAPPNPSLKLTHYGMPCKPGALHMVHHRAPGLQSMPPWAT
jgi:hypothetical protein